MLDRTLLRNETERVLAGARAKGVQAPVEEILELDRERREILTRLEAQRAELNHASKSIGQLMGQGKVDEVEAAKADVRRLKEAMAGGEARIKEVEEALWHAELQVPNLPDSSVPVGASAEENVVVREWGEKPQFDFDPKPHWEIAETHGLLDFARAAKISGSGYALYTGIGARLQRALISYMLDRQLARGYTEVYPPYLVQRDTLIGTGQLPKFEEDLYKVGEGQYLIPTAEVPVTNLYREEILEGEHLPIRLAAYSACFRSEAGAAGKDTRGIQRMHQFDKVELVKFTRPEDSDAEHEALVSDAEAILQELGLAYRVMLLCTGDMSFSNQKCYDLEVWSAGLERYLEVSSCSNYGDFQARRANIRFRPEKGAKPEFVHTLNGSGLATPRLFAALLEAYQQADGSVWVPEPLRPYLGVERIG